MAPANVGQTFYDRAVLADTGALVALSVTGDQHHAAAGDCLDAIARHRLPLYVTVPTLVETHRLILFASGPNRAREALEAAYDGTINIIRPTAANEQSARDLLRDNPWLSLSYCDALSMACMLDLGIRAAFSFDDDFLRLGFLRVPAFYEWW